MPALPTIIHATTVALGGRAVLLTGDAGSGKSATALQMIALGCKLVADDRTQIMPEGGRLIATCPTHITGLIEARGVGLLRAPHQARAEVVVVAAMDEKALERLPQAHQMTLCGVEIPVLHNPDTRYFPAALHTYLKMWRRTRSPLIH
ncbi:HPr kinase/phosphorylase [Ketogulonicigenium robustum]|uniref:HPr kinase/phosphorylase n=1 Tax=Ketogulonicigenium robustum TaxID=92947 RepID=A0A1W6NWM1_9RHOB|nr:HPr kinase/phosphatase C-terminal domain-containing protein [Ketogulonicigenium robustum]ARO13601.1 HPr kinase/phosphorylase [Ketogulonicigenium robustum]